MKSGQRMQFTVAKAEPAAIVVNGIDIDEDTPGPPRFRIIMLIRE
ncbi:MAG: hypothetical protein ABFD08_12245 [Syntrophomonas sp.]